MTKNRKLSGAARTSNARKMLEDDRKDGAQIDITKRRYCCECGENAERGQYEGPRSWIKVSTCFHCGDNLVVGGYSDLIIRSLHPKPEDHKRVWLYGARAEEVKLETRRLFTVSL